MGVSTGISREGRLIVFITLLQGLHCCFEAFQPLVIIFFIITFFFLRLKPSCPVPEVSCLLQGPGGPAPGPGGPAPQPP